MTKTPGDKSLSVRLQPGQYRAPNGVILGHDQDPDIPRFGADEDAEVTTDPDYDTD